MSTVELRSNLHILTDTIQDNKTLNTIYNLLSNSITNTSAKFPSEKKAADEAINSIKKGNFHQHDVVMAEMKKKYPNLHK